MNLGIFHGIVLYHFSNAVVWEFHTLKEIKFIKVHKYKSVLFAEIKNYNFEKAGFILETPKNEEKN